MNKWFALCLLSFSIFCPQHTSAAPFLDFTGLSPYTRYQTFETEHFTFIFANGYDHFAFASAKHFEHAHRLLSPVLKWQPRTKTTVVIADNDDSANGFTLPPFRVGIVLIATPPDPWMSTSYTEDWIKLLVFHEYIHMLNIDPTTEWMEGIRILFGDVVRPNGLWPSWMLEGLAVYFETRTSQMGRGRSPYYDSILRAFYADRKLGNGSNFGITLDRVNGDYPFFPGGETDYLFGYHLWNQFSKDQNDDSKMGEYSIRSSHRIPYFIEGNLENITGKNWSDYWNAFLVESQVRFDVQLESIKKQGDTTVEQITHAGYSALGGSISPDQRWLAYTELSKERRQGLYLVDRKTGKKKRIGDKNAGVGISFSPDSKNLIFSSLERYNTYSTFSDLWLYQIDRDRLVKLTHGVRAKDPSFSPDGKNVAFIGIEHATHLLQIADVDLNPKNPSLNSVQTVYFPPEFTILGNPRFLSDQQIVFSSQTLGKSRSDLMIAKPGATAPKTILSDGQINRYPYPMSDDTVLFTSDEGGVENIYQIGFDGNFRVKRSNVMTGAILPFAAKDGSIFASVMTSNGYEIAKLKNQTLSSKIEAGPGPSAPSSMIDALQSPELKIDRDQVKTYSPWRSMVPRQWAPIYQITSNSLDGTAVNGMLLGFDSTFKQQYFLGVQYNFKPKQFDFNLEYVFYYFRPLITLSAEEYTHDIGSGPNGDQFRRTQEAMISLTYPIHWTYSSLTPEVYGFADWRRIYNINTKSAVSSSDFEFANPIIPGYGASLIYANLERSRLGFMPEEGTELGAIAEARANPGAFTLYKYLLTATRYFRIADHSVLQPRLRWLGSTKITNTERGYSLLEGKSTQDFSDRGIRSSLKRLQIRGYSDMTIYTKSTGVASVDFHFPIDSIFSGLHNTLPLFFKQVHGFVFAETAVIPSQRLGTVYLPSYGAGINLDTTLLIRAPVTFSFEMQNGTRKDFGGDQLFFFAIGSEGLF